ncbi:MAG: membrane protein insertase YidC, partial [Alphaproteobacteria bacterium]
MDQRNLFLAIALSLVVLLGFQMLTAPSPPEPGAPAAQSTTPQAPRPGQTPGAQGQGVPVPGAPAAGSASARTVEARAAVLAASPRIRIETPRLTGSIALRGGRIDDLVLTDYRTEVAKDSPAIVLFSPVGSENPYYAGFGWTSAGAAVPGPDTIWRADRTTLTPDTPVTMTWESDEGLRFTRRYAIDGDYMLTVTQRVVNAGAAEAQLYPFGLVSRVGTPETSGFFILH